MPDYIPPGDNPFDAFQLQFINYVNANFTALGLVAGDLIPVQVGNLDWAAKYASYNVAAPTFQTITSDKNDSRAAYIAAIRSLARQILAYPALTNGQRLALGLSPAGPPPPPPPVPLSRPVGSVDTAQRLQHILTWLDEATGKVKKPEGVHGAQIFLKIGGAPPIGIEEMIHVVTDTKIPYRYDFDAADGGKTAYWVLRWVANPDNSNPGPISETLAATIPA